MLSLRFILPQWGSRGRLLRALWPAGLPLQSAWPLGSALLLGSFRAVLLGSVVLYSMIPPSMAEAAPTEAPRPELTDKDRPSVMAFEEQADTKERALSLYRQAIAEQEAGNLETSRDLYASAWELDANFDTAASLGLSELKLGRVEEASYYLEFALTHLPVTQKQRLEKTLQDSLRQARRRTARFTWRTVPEQASLTVNGEPARQPLFLVPGRYRLAASAPGYVDEVLDISVDQPEERTLAFELTPKEQLERELVVTRRRPEVLWIGGGVTALLLAGGFGFQAVGAAALDDLRDQGTDTACFDKTSKACEGRRADAESADDQQMLGTGLLVGASVSALATVVTYLLWEEEAPLQVEASAQRMTVGWQQTF